MKFNITVRNKNIVVEAPNKQALPEIVDRIIQSPEFQTAQEIQPEVAQPGLPKLEETERRIAQRREAPGGFEQARETLKKPLGFQDIMFPGDRIAEAAIPAVGEVFRRGEAAVAGPALELQKGKVSTVPVEFLKGLTGEQRAEIGDPIRATGVGGPLNEAIAATTGFFLTLGATNLASKGKLVGASKRANQAFKQARAIKGEKRARFFTERGTRLRQATEDIIDGVNKEFRKLYDRIKGIGGNPILPEEGNLAQEFLGRLPKATITRYNRQIGARTGVELGRKLPPTKAVGRKIDPRTLQPIPGQPAVPSRAIPPKDISEIKALKDIISDSVPDKVWSGVEKASQAEAIAMGDTMELADIIARNSGPGREKLLSLNDKFSRISKFRNQISGITTKAKGVKKATTLRGIRQPAQAGELEILTDFSRQFFPETETILKEIDAFNRTELIGKFGRRILSPENILRGGIITAVGRGGKKGGGFESVSTP